MEELFSIEELDNFLYNSSNLKILYIFSLRCSVCVSIAPKLLLLAEEFTNITIKKINFDNFPEISGKLSIFTLPAILLYYEGQEIHREARIISIYSLQEKLNKYSNLIS